MKKFFGFGLLFVFNSFAYAETTRTYFYCQREYLYISVLKIDENTGRIERSTRQTNIAYQSEASCQNNAAMYNEFK